MAKAVKKKARVPFDYGEAAYKKAAYDAENPPAFTVFESGTFRDSDADKIDFEGHLSPLALTDSLAPLAIKLANPAERQLGIDAGLAWRDAAQKTVVYCDRGVSRGMKYGLQAAADAGRKIEYRLLYPVPISEPAPTYPIRLAFWNSQGR